MDLRNLELFLHLADSLHFGKSADAMAVSPSTLSRAIQRLEQETDLQMLLPIRTLNTLYRAFDFDLAARLDCLSRLRHAYEQSHPPSAEEKIAWEKIDGIAFTRAARIVRLPLSSRHPQTTPCR